MKSILLGVCFALLCSSNIVIAQDSTTCTAQKQSELDACAIDALQSCFGSVGANCEQRYATADNSLGRFKEVCCCSGQAVAAKPAFSACKTKVLDGLAKTKAVLGTLATRLRANIKSTSYSACTNFPCDEF